MKKEEFLLAKLVDLVDLTKFDPRINGGFGTGPKLSFDSKIKISINKIKNLISSDKEVREFIKKIALEKIIKKDLSNTDFKEYYMRDSFGCNSKKEYIDLMKLNYVEFLEDCDVIKVDSNSIVIIA